MAAQMQTTQRAYTLRLTGTDRQDQSWKEALWRTHEAVNKGAKVFGDWLLTLRGGLDHRLASEPNVTDKRILLALSWLSVESEKGAPADYIVAHDIDKQSGKRSNWKTVEALKEILKERGLEAEEIQQWEAACKDSLEARIRDDAVWVNRSKAFDEAVKSIESTGKSLTRDEVWDMLENFFGSREAYFAPAEESPDTRQEEKAKDLGQKAGQWLSSRFGSGKGADFSRMFHVYEKISDWAGKTTAGITGADAMAELANALHEFSPASNDLGGVLGLISGPGYKSYTRNLCAQIAAKPSITQEDLQKLQKESINDAKSCHSKTGSKGRRPYSDAIIKQVETACGFTYLQDGGPAKHVEFAVMLDHAARRVSLAHTWLKRAEAERRQFMNDAKKIDNVPAQARAWLDQFCKERSMTSGALDSYRISRRAVSGWQDVVAAWAKLDRKTQDDRIASVRSLQDNPESDKFGDGQLFEALAADDAVCVWKANGKADAQILADYVSAVDAEFKKRRFKVPAYRHPDSLLHPIFCDFGKSRWQIDFSIREASYQCGFEKAKKRYDKTQNEFENARTALENSSSDPESKSKVEKRLQTAEAAVAEAKKELERLSNRKGIKMRLWTGSKMDSVPLLWQSKRLARDLALDQDAHKNESTKVARADRLGRAASNAGKNNSVNIGLFEQEDWNGRLQAPRQQLESIAVHVAKDGWDAKAKRMRDHLKWFITFSAKLQPSGPWVGYVADIPDDAEARPFVSRKGEFAVKHDSNDARGDYAKLVLSRLPGLRVLSADLGHRYAAACAVWETLSAKQVKDACRAAGHEEPKESDLFLHLKEGQRTVVFRRIGADTIADGSLHPAPWARLDRQFLIKLQGEEKEARAASNEEIWAAHQMEANLGRSVPVIDRLVKAGFGKTDKQRTRLEILRKLGWPPVNDNAKSSMPDEDDGYVRKSSLSVDELMFSSVRTARLALKRHGDRARIAFAMTSTYKPMPGDRKYYFEKALDASANDDEKTRGEARIEYLQDALSLWHDLFSSKGWKDDAAKALWEQYIVPLKGYQAPEEIPEDHASDEQKKKRKQNRDKLRAAAETLAANKTHCEVLHEKWKKRWEADDGVSAEVDKKTGRKLKDGSGWHARLRWLHDRLMPQAKQGKAIRCHTGGLSLIRLATLTEFRRKVQVGFFTRLHPDGTRADAKEQFGQSTLDALEHLREQRVKQLASRIAEAALGIGSENAKHWTGGKRPRQRIDDPRFAPCHAVVIENLTHYRPDETRTRRENRQLMTWSSSKVKKFLAEACQINGLHLREVQASYTSRQDSRTGAPGLRCQDVPIEEFMQSRFWQKQVERSKGNDGIYERFLCDLHAKWKGKSKKEWNSAGTVRVPQQGGDIFVSANAESPAAKGLHADLNAAANIGLKALADPDWPGRWWYIPCYPAHFKPAEDKVGGSHAICVNTSLKTNPNPADIKKSAKKDEKAEKKAKEYVNLWHDVSTGPISDDGNWSEFKPYWESVKGKVVNILRERAGLAVDQIPL